MRFLPIGISTLIICQLIYALEADRVIFLFDNGETNFIAALLEYAESCDSCALNNSDFYIVFMGASLDAMHKAPFSRYQDRCIDYQSFALEETVDRHWPRDRMLSSHSIDVLKGRIVARKEIWVGASTMIFKQLIDAYTDDGVASMAIRDFPFMHDPAIDPTGTTHRVRQQICAVADCVLVPSSMALQEVCRVNRSVVCVGHPPTEKYAHEIMKIDRQLVIQKLGLDAQKPIVVFAGSYGDEYHDLFTYFVSLAIEHRNLCNQVQLLILPHPRYQGVIEKEMLHKLDSAGVRYWFISHDSKVVNSLELMALADLFITPNATTSLVMQMAAAGKKVVYLKNRETQIASLLADMKIIIPVVSSEQLAMQLQKASLYKKEGMPQYPDIFHTFGIPKNSAQKLWELFNR